MYKKYMYKCILYMYKCINIYVISHKSYWLIDVESCWHSSQYSRIKILWAIGGSHDYDLCWENNHNSRLFSTG